MNVKVICGALFVLLFVFAVPVLQQLGQTPTVFVREPSDVTPAYDHHVHQSEASTDEAAPPPPPSLTEKRTFRHGKHSYTDEAFTNSEFVRFLADIKTSKGPPTLTVCGVGSEQMMELFTSRFPLPQTTDYVLFHGGKRAVPKIRAASPGSRITRISGPFLKSTWTYSAANPSYFCNVTVVEEGDADTTAMLRSASTTPHFVLYIVPYALQTLNENNARNHLTPFREQVGTYQVTKFTKHTLLQNEGLDAVLQGSWKQFDLTPLNALADALFQKAKQHSTEVQWKIFEGHSAMLVFERQIYASMAKLPAVKTICEIGFNMGHSASLWLYANPTAKVYMFDLWKHDYCPVAEKLLRSEEAAAMFGLKNVNERLTITRGSSLDTVPAFAKANPDVKCDILSVDGGHTYEIAFEDIENMKQLANPNFHVLFVDDTNCKGDACVDKACADHEHIGTMYNLLRQSEDSGWRGVSMFQYKL